MLCQITRSQFITITRQRHYQLVLVQFLLIFVNQINNIILVQFCIFKAVSMGYACFSPTLLSSIPHTSIFLFVVGQFDMTQNCKTRIIIKQEIFRTLQNYTCLGAFVSSPPCIQLFINIHFSIGIASFLRVGEDNYSPIHYQACSVGRSFEIGVFQFDSTAEDSDRLRLQKKIPIDFDRSRQ